MCLIRLTQAQPLTFVAQPQDSVSPSSTQLTHSLSSQLVLASSDLSIRTTPKQVIRVIS